MILMMYPMSRNERLERWAMLLERCENGRLMPFYELEYRISASLADARQAGSPLSIAYQDPVLRRAGLESDRYGDGARFFELSRSEAHRILCSCGYMGVMRASEVANRIRMLSNPPPRRTWNWTNPLTAVARWLGGSRPLAGVNT